MCYTFVSYTGSVDRQERHPDIVESTGRVLLDNLDCSGSEASLAECRHVGWGSSGINCEHHEDVILQCMQGTDTSVATRRLREKKKSGASLSKHFELQTDLRQRNDSFSLLWRRR